MTKGDTFIYSPGYVKPMKVTYTGTSREVKGVIFHFFTTETGECVLFYPSEIVPPKFIKYETDHSQSKVSI
jgi:hypothetical protein